MLPHYYALQCILIPVRSNNVAIYYALTTHLLRVYCAVTLHGLRLQCLYPPLTTPTMHFVAGSVYRLQAALPRSTGRFRSSTVFQKGGFQPPFWHFVSTTCRHCLRLADRV